MEIFEISSVYLAVTALALLALGGAAGFFAGLLGIGGGAVLVPGFYFLLAPLFPVLGADAAHIMHVCVGTSLAVIVPTGLVSARAHHRRGAVDFALVRALGAGVVLGVAVGTAIAGMVDGRALRLFFAFCLGGLSVLMAVDPARFARNARLPRQPWPFCAGGVIGGVSTLVGIGGATLSVPFLTFCGVGIRRAIGTASALGLLIAIPAALGFVVIGQGVAGLPPLSVGYVNLAVWACTIPASILAAPYGAAAAHRLPVKVLKPVFAAFVFLIALRMGWGAAG